MIIFSAADTGRYLFLGATRIMKIHTYLSWPDSILAAFHSITEVLWRFSSFESLLIAFMMRIRLFAQGHRLFEGRALWAQASATLNLLILGGDWHVVGFRTSGVRMKEIKEKITLTYERLSIWMLIFVTYKITSVSVSCFLVSNVGER